ncbi:hypothetical protein HZH68_013336 [Vespula germanica]|uniref:Uncharacterized protein n=1 Tax=Vespula germanica TaxID=30212 RepID=A0A834JFM4_VESGE|nr:hypothetical protein HZH68_013336 [Vespula germanica]
MGVDGRKQEQEKSSDAADGDGGGGSSGGGGGGGGSGGGGGGSGGGGCRGGGRVGGGRGGIGGGGRRRRGGRREGKEEKEEVEGQSSLLITVLSQCEDKSKENRRVIQRSLGNPTPSASKEFVNVHEETSPVPALEFKCERICTHALTRPRPSTIAVNGLTSARAELRPTCAN